MNTTSVLFGIIFLISGMYVASGSVLKHLTGWRKMAEKDKAKIKIKPLCYNIGTMIIISGILFLLNGVWFFFQGYVFIWGMIGWLILSGIDIYWIEKSAHYYKK